MRGSQKIKKIGSNMRKAFFGSNNFSINSLLAKNAIVDKNNKFT